MEILHIFDVALFDIWFRKKTVHYYSSLSYYIWIFIYGDFLSICLPLPLLRAHFASLGLYAKLFLFLYCDKYMAISTRNLSRFFFWVWLISLVTTWSTYSGLKITNFVKLSSNFFKFILWKLFSFSAIPESEMLWNLHLKPQRIKMM